MKFARSRFAKSTLLFLALPLVAAAGCASSPDHSRTDSGESTASAASMPYDKSNFENVDSPASLENRAKKNETPSIRLENQEPGSNIEGPQDLSSEAGRR